MRLSPAPLAPSPTLSQRQREQNRLAFSLQNVFCFCYLKMSYQRKLRLPWRRFLPQTPGR